MKVLDLFKIMMVVQLFYAFAIVTVAYALPADSLVYMNSYEDLSNRISLKSVGDEVKDSIESQTNIPVIELGALVFYSGNILIDLLLNFAFAIPEMIGLLIKSIMMLFNVDSYIFATIEVFSGVVLMVMYFVGIIQLLTGLRSGRLV